MLLLMQLKKILNMNNISNFYKTVNQYLKDIYGERIQKISLDAGFTCPNRDGTLDTRGCIFCSSAGSGDFASKVRSETILSQIEKSASDFIKMKRGSLFIGYFQAFTNTYAPIPLLRELFSTALSSDKLIGISIATRPDCLSQDVLTLLEELKGEFPTKLIWIELGLQSMHEETAIFIRRGYPLKTFEDAVFSLNKIHIPIIVHTIIGLPNETKQHIIETISYLNTLPIWGIKLQLLHILKDTDLATLYQTGLVNALEKEEYLDILIDCIEHLSPKIVIHRVTGDGKQDQVIAPLFSTKKKDVLNSLHREMKKRDSYQGKQYNIYN